MKREKIIALVEGGIMIALAFVLSRIKVLEMPQGGSITLKCLPLLVYAYRRRFLNGVTAATAFSIIHFALDPYHSFHPVSILGDYLLPGAAIACIGFRSSKNLVLNSVKIVFIYIAKYIFGVLSGVVVFYSYSGVSGADTLGEALKSAGVWIYSAGYNSYLFVEMVLVAVVFGILQKAVMDRYKI